MPFTNFESRHFSELESTAIDQTMMELETKLAAKLANLSPQERQQYGSVSEQNKLIINKVKHYRDTQAALSSPDVDWPEFENDYITRAYLGSIMQRLESLIDGLKNAKILHDWDNYQAALTDYDYAKYKINSGAISYATKVDEVGQFFSRGPHNPPNNEP